MRSVDYKPDYSKRLRNPGYSRGLLKTVFEGCSAEGNWEAFGLLLQDIVTARGDKRGFSKQANISRQQLRRLFGKKATLPLSALSLALSRLGLKLSIEEDRESKREAV